MDNHCPEACELGKQVIEDLFGDIVAHVCEKLLQKGALSLSQLNALVSELPPSLIHGSLLVLIQHNFVRVFKIEVLAGNSTRDVFFYEALFDRVLQNLRKPWVLFYAGKQLSEMCEIVLEALLENGRLQFDQIMLTVSGKLKKDVDEIEEEAKNALIRLISNHYIERCPPCSLYGRSTEGQEETTKKRTIRGPKDITGPTNTALMERKEYEKDRFRLPLSLVLDDPNPGEKRKEQEPLISEKDILWRVHVEEFNRSYRHHCCVNLVSSKIGKEAALALKCMLDVSKLSESKVNEDVSRPVSVDELMKVMEETIDAPHRLSLENLNTALRALKDDQLELVTCVGEQSTGSVYCVNLTRIIECCQLVLLETSVRDRFGPKALRIFRLLLFKKQLEQKQIADLAMLDPKEARSILYDMLKAGYVIIQDIPKSTDHAASRTFFTWKVSLQESASHFRRDLYRASRNIHSRLITELKKGNELLTLLELSQTNREAVHITEKQRTQTGKLSSILRVLEMSLMNLDQSIGIMNNFSC